METTDTSLAGVLGQRSAQAAPEEAKGASFSLNGVEKPSEAPGAWERNYDGEAALKNYATADPDDPTKWRYDHAKLAKSHSDRQAEITRLQQEMAQLRKGDADDPVPETIEEYMQGLDRDALKKHAPRSYVPAKDGKPHAGEQAFFAAAKEMGVSLTKARKMFGVFMGGLNGYVPEPQTAEQRMAAAVKEAGPNGAQMLADNDDALTAMHRSQPWQDVDMALIDEIRHHPRGQVILQRLLRHGARAGGPPKVESSVAGDVMTLDEIHQAMNSERYRNSEAFRKRIGEAYARAQGKVSDAEGHGFTMELHG